MAENKPAKKIRLGRMVACIWANEKGEEVDYITTLKRLYKEGDAWNDSPRYYHGDLPIGAKLLDMAYSWIADHQTAPSADDVEP